MTEVLHAYPAGRLTLDALRRRHFRGSNPLNLSRRTLQQANYADEAVGVQ